MKNFWHLWRLTCVLGLTMGWMLRAASAGEVDLPRRMPVSVALLPSAARSQPIIEPLPDEFPNSSMPMQTQIPMIGEEISLDGATITGGPNETGMIQDGDFFPAEAYMMGNGSSSEFTCGDMTVSNCQECGECQDCWFAQTLPNGLIYHSYLAGPKEPRFAAVFWHDKRLGWQLDYTVGGRVPLFRFGNADPIWPQGFQIDLEGAAFPRVNLHENMDLDAADYRVGIPLTYGIGKWQTKFAAYHLSAHVGDEYLIRNPTYQRINYVRDCLVLGQSWYPVDPLRVYGEVEFAFHTDGGAKPWAFQFGSEFSPLRNNGIGGDPFVAINAYLRQDVNYGGNLTIQAGWQWRGTGNRHLLRTGLHFLTGNSNQFQFFRTSEQQLGIGVWYDF